MQITRTSPFTGKVHTQEIDVSERQIKRWIEGDSIQNVMPQLSADEREFIKTGIVPEEWEETFGKEADDDKNDEPFADESKW